MEFETIGRHVEITEPVRSYLAERRDRMAKFFDRIHSLKIIISADGANHTAEFIAHLVKAETIVSKGSAPDLFAAIEAGADRMEEQIRKYTEKLRGHRAWGEEAAAPAPSPAEEDEQAPPIEEIE